MSTGSFPGVKRPGRCVDHTPPSSAEVKERVKLYFYSPSGPSSHVIRWTLRKGSFISKVLFHFCTQIHIFIL